MGQPNNVANQQPAPTGKVQNGYQVVRDPRTGEETMQSNANPPAVMYQLGFKPDPLKPQDPNAWVKDESKPPKDHPEGFTPPVHSGTGLWLLPQGEGAAKIADVITGVDAMKSTAAKMMKIAPMIKDRIDYLGAANLALPPEKISDPQKRAAREELERLRGVWDRAESIHLDASAKVIGDRASMGQLGLQKEVVPDFTKNAFTWKTFLGDTSAYHRGLAFLQQSYNFAEHNGRTRIAATGAVPAHEYVQVYNGREYKTVAPALTQGFKGSPGVVPANSPDIR